ncbi:helix-turn-helix domain-containing protein [Streptomyces sp. NPDC058572]|uniref:helix-turn-helix domain-containing protein n=1 Tax=Streptomyces sp. NPDC058572 TaxID=3346546 RepID=UPI003654E168
MAVSTVKSLLHDAARDGGGNRAVSRVLADRLLAVGVADLPRPGCGYGGRSADAAPAMRHIRWLMESHPGLSMSALARAVGMTPSTLAAAFGDVEAGRPRRIRTSAAERLLALGSAAPLPDVQARRCDTVDAAPVAGHVRGLQLRYDGAGLALIARTAGINPSTLTSALGDHAHNPARGINRHLAACVLAVTELPAPASPRHAHVTTTGLIRRLQALCALGWTLASISQIGGTTPRSLCDLLRTQRSTPAQRSSVLTAWHELSHRPGPSTTARRRAAAKGWAPPLAWDEHAIDRPDHTPSGTRTTGHNLQWTPELLHHELEFLTDLGIGRAQALQRLGLSTTRAQALLAPPAPTTANAGEAPRGCA